MLPWILRALRFGLLALGTLFLVSLPLSFFYQGFLQVGVLSGAVTFHVRTGTLTIGISKSPQFPWGERYLGPVQNASVPPSAIVPTVFYYADMPVELELPLWLLAAVCLAWPVASFISHLRRQKRGFPLEPKGASDSEAAKVQESAAGGGSSAFRVE
jgi:hypothetical protein